MPHYKTGFIVCIVQRRCKHSKVNGCGGGGGDLVTQLFQTPATSWAIVHQVPLSMRFSSQEY